MSNGLEVSVTSGRFKKIRAWNRRRNYYIKQVKLNTKIYFAKLIWDKHKKNVFDIKSIKTILLVRNEGTIGDVVVSTPLVKSLNEAGYKVDLLLTKSSSEVMKYNPYARNVYESGDCKNEVFLKGFGHNVAESTMEMLKKNNYDLVVDLSVFDIPVHRMMLFRDINARFVLGFNKWNCINHYSKSISFKNDKEHVTKAISLVANTLGLDLKNSHDYDLHIPANIVDEVQKYLSPWEDKIKIVINVFTGSPERNISLEQLSQTIEMLNQESDNIIITILDHRKELNIPLPENIVINPFNSLHHVMELIKKVDLIISPDTSIVHISAAWKKPLVCVYKNVTDNNYLWGPGYKEASQIIVDNRKIADVEKLPKLIMQEVIKMGVLKNRRS